MRRDGIDLSIANWTPPWEHRTQIHHRTTPIGMVCHPTYDPTAADCPAAPPMDFPVYPDYYAQVTGNLRVGTLPENPYVRATADDFYQSQLTRGS
eukprot:3597489-Pyramimonas_sp.AAC.1